MNTIDTRDLYTRKCELESLRDAVTEAADELREALESYGFSKDEIEEAILEKSLPPVADDHVFTKELLDLEKALIDASDEYGTPEQEELAALEAIESEMDARAFRDGETLIPERDFEEYARELAEDCYGDAALREWPGNCIDWKQAAEELQQDYSSVEYEGTTYYFRS